MSLSRDIAVFRFNVEVRVALYRKLKTYAKHNVAMADALDSLYKSYQKEDNDPVKLALSEWLVAMRNGTSFSDAVRGWIPANEVMLLQAGEDNDSLDEAFESLVQVTESTKAMRNSIIESATYPVILFLVFSVMLGLFATWAVPHIASISDPATWPKEAAVLYSISMFVSTFGIPLLVLVIGFSLGLVWYLPKWTGESRRMFDSLPIISIYRDFQASSFLIAMSSMLKARISIADSVDRMRVIAQPYMEEHLNLMARHLEQGFTEGKAMDTGLFDKDTAIDLEIFGELGQLEDSLEDIGLNSIETGVARVKIISKLIGNALIAIVGAYIGWTIYAVSILSESLDQSVMGMML